MKSLLLVPLFALITLTGCENLDIAPEIPDCVEKKINYFNKHTNCDDREPSVKASVQEYKFQNKIVYVFNQGNCNPDSGAEVIDSDCNKLGYLGGIANIKEVDGVIFYSNATFIRKIWEK